MQLLTAFPQTFSFALRGLLAVKIVDLQEVVGKKDPRAGPKVMRHTMVQPLPNVEKSSEGVLEVPEEIQCWKGSVFSIFSRGVANWDSTGYGALLQTPSVRALPVLAHI